MSISKILKEDNILEFNTSFKKLLESNLNKRLGLNEEKDCAVINIEYGDYEKGTEVKILDFENGVYKVKFPDGEKDSMKKDLLDFESDEDEEDEEDED